MAEVARDIDHLELIIQLIDAIGRRLEGRSREDFLTDQDESDTLRSVCRAELDRLLSK